MGTSEIHVQIDQRVKNYIMDRFKGVNFTILGLIVNIFQL